MNHLTLVTDNTNDPTFAELQVGDVVNGSTVVFCKKLADRVIGDVYATWVAMLLRDSKLHPYSVHDVVARPNGFQAFSGDYCATLDEAVEAYKRRGGV